MKMQSQQCKSFTCCTAASTVSVQVQKKKEKCDWKPVRVKLQPYNVTEVTVLSHCWLDDTKDIWPVKMCHLLQ